MRRLVATFALATILGGICLPGTAFALGWKPVLASDFSAATLPADCHAYEGLPSVPSATYYRPDEVQVAAGLLRLNIRGRSSEGRAYTSGGIGCYGVGQQYGRYEFRARMALVPGVVSRVMLWPEDGQPEDLTSLDFYSEQGNPSSGYQVHITNGFGSGGPNRQVLSTSVEAFHEFRIDWLPDGITVQVDGIQVYQDSRASRKARWLGFAVTTGENLAGLPEPGMLPTEFLIDWMRGYQLDPQASADASDARRLHTALYPNDNGSNLVLRVMLVLGFGVIVAVVAGLLAAERHRRG